MHAARRGYKTLVMSTDLAHSLADALACPLDAAPGEVEPGLHAQQVDPRARLVRDWERLQDRLTRLLDELGVDGAAAEELTALPAASEVLALLEVRDQVRAGLWDVVVVDCAATAETLRLLALPEALGLYLERALPPGRRVARAIRAGRTGGTGRDPLLEELRRLGDELADVRTLLTDTATGVRLVLTAERVVLAEARRTLTHLSLLGFGVEAVVVNRLVPAGQDPWRAARSAREAAVLAEVGATFEATPVLALQDDVAEPVGPEALARLADQLYGTGSAGRAHDPLTPVDRRPAMRVERSGSNWVLVLALPQAHRADLDLRRRGDDLEVGVGTARRILTLPSVLRRCRVVRARLHEGDLRVVFEPDPALWPGARGDVP